MDIKNIRREFHRYAETSWNEIRTSARVAELLEKIGVKNILVGKDVVDTKILLDPVDMSVDKRNSNMKRAIEQGAPINWVKKTDGYPGVLGIINTKRPGPTYALRFDMDCLPYGEFNKEGYRPYDEGFNSLNPNCVHACGHDGHTAIGLGLAEHIIKNIGQYKGVIKLIFQPAEETTLGAQSIVNKGHLDDVDIFLAIHLALSAENVPLKSHMLVCGCKDFLSNRQLDVTFHGHAAHPCGAAQEGKNALLAACSAALNLHCIAPHEKGIGRVNVGEISGGVCTNTIAPECTIKLEYRGEYQEIVDYLEKRVFDILDGTARTYDLTYSYVDHGEVPTSRSDDKLMELVRLNAKNVPWFQTVYFEGNLGGTDDAAIMMNKVKENGGMASYIGIGTKTTAPLHNPKFDFDEKCLRPSIELLGFVIKNSDELNNL